MDKYKYIGSSKIYTFIRAVKMKSPVTRAWIDAVLYIGEPKDGETPVYVREWGEFFKKFEKI